MDLLLELLRVDSRSSLGVESGGYWKIVRVLEAQMQRYGMTTKIWELVPGKPIIVGKLTGEDESLPGILLNGHYDVVPVDWSKWTKDPFAGFVDEQGKIFGRGSQDMKGVIAGYLEAIGRIRERGIVLKRNVYVSCVPDEEIGGRDGMEKFCNTDDFRALNIGFAMDEGIPSSNQTIQIYNGERSVWWVKVSATGEAGHASRFISKKDGSTQKLLNAIKKFNDFRDEEIQRLKNNCLDIGEITTVNLTCMESGNSSAGSFNVLPSTSVAVFDIRIPPSVDLEDFVKSKIAKWCESSDCEYELLVSCESNPSTDIEGAGKKWWDSIQDAISSAVSIPWNVVEKPLTLTVATDARFIRRNGIPCFGMSAICNSQVLLHDHDEHIDSDVLNTGIEVYVEILKKIANLT